jgi:hypothetical protein
MSTTATTERARPARRGRPLKGTRGPIRGAVKTSIGLTPGGKRRLERLAELGGQTQKGVIEALLEREARRRGIVIEDVENLDETRHAG